MSLSVHLGIATIIGLLSFFIASRRGRNPYLWFFIGFLFGIFGILAIFIVSRAKDRKSAIPQKIEPQPFIDGPKDKFWYFLNSARQQQGPVSHNALTQAWKKGEVAATTLVWHEDLSEWKELHELIKTTSSP